MRGGWNIPTSQGPWTSPLPQERCGRGGAGGDPMMWGAGRGGGEGGGSRRGRGPLQDGLPFRVGSLETSAVTTLRCPAHLRLGCGIDTQDLGRRRSAGAQAPPPLSPGQARRERESLPSEGPGVWGVGSHFVLVKVDPRVRGRWQRTLGRPWAGSASPATGKGVQNSTRPFSAPPSPHHGQTDTPG